MGVLDSQIRIQDLVFQRLRNPNAVMLSVRVEEQLIIVPTLSNKSCGFGLLVKREGDRIESYAWEGCRPYPFDTAHLRLGRYLSTLIAKLSDSPATPHVTASAPSAMVYFCLLWTGQLGSLRGPSIGVLVQPWLAKYYNPGTQKTGAAGPLSS